MNICGPAPGREIAGGGASRGAAIDGASPGQARSPAAPRRAGWRAPRSAPAAGRSAGRRRGCREREQHAERERCRAQPRWFRSALVTACSSGQRGRHHPLSGHRGRRQASVRLARRSGAAREVAVGIGRQAAAPNSTRLLRPARAAPQFGCNRRAASRKVSGSTTRFEPTSGLGASMLTLPSMPSSEDASITLKGSAISCPR